MMCAIFTAHEATLECDERPYEAKRSRYDLKEQQLTQEVVSIMLSLHHIVNIEKFPTD
jgi:hypothetical protein